MMKKFRCNKSTTRKKNNRKTPYIYINGIKATTFDTKALWDAHKKGKDHFKLSVDADGDFILTSD